MKSLPKTRPTVDIQEVASARWEVSRERERSFLTMKRTSSTAEVVKGALEVVETGRRRDSERSVGVSSIWKAFSTDRRMKKVVMIVKGVINRAEIL